MAGTYALLEWEDQWVNVISVVTILEPRKDVSLYKAGEIIKAKYKGKPYKAIICELSDDRKYLEDRKKKKQLNGRYSPPADNLINLIDTEDTENVKKRKAADQESETNRNEPSPTRTKEPELVHVDLNKPKDSIQELGSSEDSSEEREIPSSLTKERGTASNKNSDRRMMALEKEVEELKNELRRFKRRVRLLEQERTMPVETVSKSKEDDEVLYNGSRKSELSQSVEKVGITEGVEVLFRKLFSLEEIRGSSLSGKCSAKSGADGPRPAMDNDKVRVMSAVLRDRFGESFSRKTMVEKVQNIQKVERMKFKKMS